ncbi:ASKHA domain-containing protein [Geobacter sp.]|uniref:ASKHA domain-containing protein n=1 Tax=Geobacter sp. TaxID=46610 RepID=UPI0027B8FEAF|nr:ASKHA domain-containing protein [Geobacter sp.]
MPTVRFLPDDRSIIVPSGTTLLEAGRMAGVTIEAPCNGAGTCGKCRVLVTEENLASLRLPGGSGPFGAGEGVSAVLACHGEIVADLTVTVPERKEEGLKIAAHGVRGDVTLRPFVVKRYDPVCNETSVVAGDKLLAVEQGDTTDERFGLVVDIGTTTLVAALIDLADGRELATASALNPQSLHAQDILSRIRFASTHRGLDEMRQSVVAEINRLAVDVAGKAGVEPERIYEAVFSGNTTMLYLACGVDPAPLGKYPYTVELRGGCHRSVAETGIAIAPVGMVYLPPVISAYVGADITAGILATRLHEKPGTTLLVDIGTNGEMAIVKDGTLWATSTAAGPAFEGMNITCGMRAGEGAIERFYVRWDGEVEIGVIGGGVATGICGSGLIDIVAELVTAGVIGPNGRFVAADAAGIPAHLRERLVKRDGKPTFRLTEKVSLTQQDIRQVQLAKGAIRAGIELLLRHLGIGAGDVDRVLIAGSFGYHLRAESLTALGLLPSEFSGKIDFVGNTSKTGGEAFLLDRESRREMEILADAVEVVELAAATDFDKVFIATLKF